MRKMIFLLLFFISVNCSSQIKHYYKKHLLFSKIAPMAFIKSGIAIYKQDTLNITNIGFGISLTNGKVTNDLNWGPLPLVWSWKYKAIP